MLSSSTSRLLDQLNQCRLPDPHDPLLMGCSIAEFRKSELDMKLKYNKGDYLFNLLQNAMSNDTIRKAFEHAEYNFDYSSKKTFYSHRSANEIFTASSHLKIIKTSEDSSAAVITWAQGSSLRAAGWKNLNGRVYRLKTVLNDYLFLSEQETVYIPAPPPNDLEALRYYEGMHGLYGMHSRRQYMDSDLVRAIADRPEVVRLIGENCAPRLSAEGHQVGFTMQKDRFVLTDSVPSCHTEDYHIFQRQYWFSGMFSRGISYQHQQNIPAQVGRMLDPEYCSEYERSTFQP